MSNMGGTRHLKRLAAASCLKIKRKEFKWIVKPSPGPHPKNLCIPLAVLIRDYLGFARNMREVKYIFFSIYYLLQSHIFIKSENNTSWC